MKRHLKELKSLQQSESNESILKNFQAFIAGAMTKINSALPGQTVVLIFTNGDRGTPIKARKTIEDWIDQQPWRERVQIHIQARS
ncbi:MAG: hypothetical protein KME32_28305 [Mojavia pulchra JT2-VF2]|jgi:hypothetical protein|uniref:Uncharacterized protein n=1 Tax=Mojavia pulchra JT2-VF2 TaxID=287848 RepID=A0A951Q426_9NOST|nr:hypothetical protein [Mojavia pulchra JT2-VF2]